MDDELRPDLDPTLGQRLVFRSGDPQLPSSLELANVDEARAVIVLPAERHGDADVVTVVLTLGRMIGFEHTPIVAEVSSDLMRDKLLRVAGPNLHPVIVAEAASRATALVLRQSGLSEVVEELVDAATPGVHVKERPELIGSTFGDAVLGFDTSRPIGVIAANGTLRMNPPGCHDHRVQATRSWRSPRDLRPSPRADSSALLPTAASVHLGIEPSAMRLLFIGWNELASTLLAEFDRFAAPGSTAHVLIDDSVLPVGDVSVPVTVNFDVSCRPGSDPRDLLREGEYTSVVLLAYTDGISPAEADGRTLLDLALVRKEIAAASSAAPQLLVAIARRRPLCRRRHVRARRLPHQRCGREPTDGAIRRCAGASGGVRRDLRPRSSVFASRVTRAFRRHRTDRVRRGRRLGIRIGAARGRVVDVRRAWTAGGVEPRDDRDGGAVGPDRRDRLTSSVALRWASLVHENTPTTVNSGRCAPTRTPAPARTRPLGLPVAVRWAAPHRGTSVDLEPTGSTAKILTPGSFSTAIISSARSGSFGISTAAITWSPTATHVSNVSLSISTLCHSAPGSRSERPNHTEPVEARSGLRSGRRA